MKTLLRLSLVLAGALALTPLAPAQASVTTTGYVDPAPSGSPATWDAGSGSLYIGSGPGDGSLTISGGGTVTHSGGIAYLGNMKSGTLTVTGAGSTWTSDYADGDGTFYVGASSGTGIMNITAGGAVTQENVYAAQGSNAVATVTVDGAGSSWTTQSLFLGDSGGSATLSIQNQGTVTSSYAYLGNATAGSRGYVTVTDGGSKWNITNYLTVGVDSGDSGAAISEVMITGGRVQIGGDLTIGLNTGAVGTMTVAGNGSTLTATGNLEIGSEGSGSLNITGGGQVSSQSFARIAAYSGSGGQVEVRGSGSAWNIAGNLDVGGWYNDAYNEGAGGSPWFILGPGGTVTVGGTLRNWSDSTIYLNGGALSAETIDLSRGGTLGFKLLSPTTDTGYGSISATSSLIFGGILAVSRDNGYTPHAGDTFDLFNYATATGTFDDLQLFDLDSGLAWDTSQIYTTGTLGVTAVPEPAASALLLGAALLAWAVLRRRARRKVIRT